MNTPSALVQKLWNYCNILRDDGLSFRLHPLPARQDGDYVEQLKFLLFLKMADEQTRPPFNKPSAVPRDFAWPTTSSALPASACPFYRKHSPGGPHSKV